MKIDLLDKKILYELDKNSRKSFSAIAKTIRAKKETVRYRINKLIEDKVISHLFTVVDISKLGLTLHKTLIKLQKATPLKKQEIINYLTSVPEIDWVVSLDGDYDIGFNILSGDIHIVNSILDKFFSKYSDFIIKKTFTINIFGEYTDRDYLVKKEHKRQESSIYMARKEKVQLDSKDKKILQLLCNNSRMNSIEISKKVRLSPDAVIIRIKNLEKKGIITGYKILLNQDLLDNLYIKTMFYLRDLDEKKQSQLRSYLKSIANSFYIIKALGNWDSEVDFEVKDIKEYRKIMVDITKKYGESIKDYFFLTISKVHKYSFLPKDFVF